MRDEAKIRRIAIYLPSLRGGGAERVMVTLANGFASRGCEVDLVLVKAEGPYLEEVSSAVRVVDLKCSRVLTSLPSLVRYLRRERPDATLSALRHVNIIAVIARMLAWSATRLVVSERNSLVGLPKGLKGVLCRPLMRLTYLRAHGVVAPSKGLARELVSDLRLPANRVRVIYNPVDVAAIQRASEARPDHPWFDKGAPPVVLAVGRLVKQKDYPTLLAAFALLLTERDARLIILGEGELRRHLEALAMELGIAAKIDFVGFHKNPFGWMSSSAVYVMSSRHEGLPNTLVQAMACGIRVVSTDCPTGPAEILEEGKWGRLVPVGDPQAMARAMGAALDDPAPPDVRRRVEAFDPEEVISAYERELVGVR